MKLDPQKPGFGIPDSGPGSGNRLARHSIRLKGYDYSHAGGYFVTIVTQSREPFFGRIVEGKIILSDAGQMVMDEWQALPERFPNIEMDIFQVMPNHFHAILFIHNPTSVGAGLVPAPGLVPVPEAGTTTRVAPTDMKFDDAARVTTRVAPTLGDIIGAYKSITTHKYIQGVHELGWPSFTKRFWQHNYYEHIIRNQVDYDRITGYICNNPINWEQDNENPMVRSQLESAFP